MVHGSFWKSKGLEMQTYHPSEPLHDDGMRGHDPNLSVFGDDFHPI